MNRPNQLILAMAERCRSLILAWDKPKSSLPKALQPDHLIWMCNQIEKHANTGRVARLHRWIGFVQAAMLAHEMLDFDGLKTMFDNSKLESDYAIQEWKDLSDHLDPSSPFEFDLGGEA